MTTRTIAVDLESFAKGLVKFRDDRKALATLRKGLVRAPGQVPEIIQYLAPLIPPRLARIPDLMDLCYLVGSLYALHPETWKPPDDARAGPTFVQNFGSSAARLRNEGEGLSNSMEQRFIALLAAHKDDLPSHLRYSVTILRGSSIPVNWSQLLLDLRGWEWDDNPVQRRWAESFWGTGNSQPLAASASESESTTDEIESD